MLWERISPPFLFVINQSFINFGGSVCASDCPETVPKCWGAVGEHTKPWLARHVLHHCVLGPALCFQIRLASNSLPRERGS